MCSFWKSSSRIVISVIESPSIFRRTAVVYPIFFGIAEALAHEIELIGCLINCVIFYELRIIRTCKKPEVETLYAKSMWYKVDLYLFVI